MPRARWKCSSISVQMPHLLPLGTQIVRGRFQRLDHRRNPLRHAHAGLLQSLDLLRIVGHQPHRPQPEVPHHGRGSLVAPQIRLETKLFVRLHGIRAVILQLIGAQLVEQPDPAAFLVLVNQQAPALARDGLQCQLQLGAAIAAQAVEHVSREALRMNPHQRRIAVLQVAHLERHDFFCFAARCIGEPVDPEVPETAGEIRLGDLSKLNFWGHLYQ